MSLLFINGNPLVKSDESEFIEILLTMFILYREKEIEMYILCTQRTIISN